MLAYPFLWSYAVTRAERSTEIILTGYLGNSGLRMMGTTTITFSRLVGTGRLAASPDVSIEEIPGLADPGAGVTLLS